VRWPKHSIDIVTGTGEKANLAPPCRCRVWDHATEHEHEHEHLRDSLVDPNPRSGFTFHFSTMGEGDGPSRSAAHRQPDTGMRLRSRRPLRRRLAWFLVYAKRHLASLILRGGGGTMKRGVFDSRNRWQLFVLYLASLLILVGKATVLQDCDHSSRSRLSDPVGHDKTPHKRTDAATVSPRLRLPRSRTSA